METGGERVLDPQDFVWLTSQISDFSLLNSAPLKQALTAKIREFKIITLLFDMVAHEKVSELASSVNLQVSQAIEDGILLKAEQWNQMFKSCSDSEDQELVSKTLRFFKYFTKLLLTSNNCSSQTESYQRKIEVQVKLFNLVSSTP